MGERTSEVGERNSEMGERTSKGRVNLGERNILVFELRWISWKSSAAIARVIYQDCSVCRVGTRSKNENLKVWLSENRK